MLFRNSKTLYNQNIPKVKQKERSKIRSTTKGILPICNTNLIHAERASAFTSKKGSITVEAAIAVPLFFFAVVCLFYLMEILSIQTSVRAGLQYAGKEIAEESYPAAIISTEKIQGKVINAIGAERLDRSMIEGGSQGLDCRSSVISPVTGIGDLSVKYQIRIPIPVFRIGLLDYEETMRMKTWTGYEKGGLSLENDEIVYVTETGLVYHKDYHCTHLDLSIRMVPVKDIENMRNENGGKYHACERCRGQTGTKAYITDNGDKYHSSLSCSGLKRTIYAVRKSEVVGKRACSKCSVY